jgi:hypothetical protein
VVFIIPVRTDHPPTPHMHDREDTKPERT